MGQLKIYQALWSMDNMAGNGAESFSGNGAENHLTRNVERSLDDNLAMIAEAGFDGVSAHYTNIKDVENLNQKLAGWGLGAEGLCFPKTIDDLKPVLEIATKYGVHHITIQADVRPKRLEDCLRLLDGWLELASGVDFPVLFETHRDRMTMDLYQTLDMLASRPDMRFTADISHYVVAREMALPITHENNAMIKTILDHALAFHGRVAGSGQVQLELSFRHNKDWVEQFKQWSAYGLKAWKNKAKETDTICFTCELGPRPYAIVSQNGQDSTDRWSESKQMKRMVEEIWSSID